MFKGWFSKPVLIVQKIEIRLCFLRKKRIFFYTSGELNFYTSQELNQ
jgi:hypothetical protein